MKLIIEGNIVKEAVNAILEFCFKKGALEYELDFGCPPEGIENEIIVSPEMLGKSTQVEKGKKLSNGSYTENRYKLKTKIDANFRQWTQKRYLLGLGFYEMKIYKDGKLFAEFQEEMFASLYDINRKDIEKLKKQLIPFEKNMRYYESE